MRLSMGLNLKKGGDKMATAPKAIGKSKAKEVAMGKKKGKC